MFAAVLSPPGNSRKLQICWSSPLLVTQILNLGMVKIKQLNMLGPGEFCAHRSKIHLSKEFGQKETDPLFMWPRLPKIMMDQLAEDLSVIELPCKV